MESKIIKQEKNPFLSREEFVIEITSKVPPTFDEVKKILGKEDNLIVVRRVDGNFGRQLFTAVAVVYDSVEAKNKIEVIPKKVKKKLAEEAKAKVNA